MEPRSKNRHSSAFSRAALQCLSVAVYNGGKDEPYSDSIYDRVLSYWCSCCNSTVRGFVFLLFFGGLLYCSSAAGDAFAKYLHDPVDGRGGEEQQHHHHQGRNHGDGATIGLVCFITLLLSFLTVTVVSTVTKVRWLLLNREYFSRRFARFLRHWFLVSVPLYMLFFYHLFLRHRVYYSPPVTIAILVTMNFILFPALCGMRTEGAEMSTVRTSRQEEEIQLHRTPGNNPWNLWSYLLGRATLILGLSILVCYFYWMPEMEGSSHFSDYIGPPYLTNITTSTTHNEQVFELSFGGSWACPSDDPSSQEQVQCVVSIDEGGSRGIAHRFATGPSGRFHSYMSNIYVSLIESLSNGNGTDYYYGPEEFSFDMSPIENNGTLIVSGNNQTENLVSIQGDCSSCKIPTISAGESFIMLSRGLYYTFFGCLVIIFVEVIPIILLSSIRNNADEAYASLGTTNRHDRRYDDDEMGEEMNRDEMPQASQSPAVGVGISPCYEKGSVPTTKSKKPATNVVVMV